MQNEIKWNLVNEENGQGKNETRIVISLRNKNPQLKFCIFDWNGSQTCSELSGYHWQEEKKYSPYPKGLFS